MPIAFAARDDDACPENTTFDFYGGLGAIAPPALSPGGRRMVFGAWDKDGKSTLWVRQLDALIAQPLAGTDGAIHPFWSPDSKFIGFFADSKLKRSMHRVLRPSRFATRRRRAEGPGARTA
jgi:hypothetical protein